MKLIKEDRPLDINGLKKKLGFLKAKGRSWLLFGCAFSVFLVSGCGVKDKEAGSFEGGETAKETEGNGGPVVFERDGKEYFKFYDAEGNEHEAPLFNQLRQCVYENSHFKTDEKSGYRSYSDEQNGVVAKLGIDVSEFQGEDIDWERVKKSGIEFVIVRVGYRAYGESGDLVSDAMFEKNIQGASEAGLDVGVYFFSQAISAAEAVEEAEFVVDCINHYNVTGPVVYDTEEITWDTARTSENTGKEITNYCKVFCETIEHAGYEPMIYTNLKWMAFTLDMEELQQYDFWYADYYEYPQCPYDYEMWQYTENGVVDGINANVDMNLWFQEK